MGAKLASRTFPGRRRSAAERTTERLFIEPAERREAMLGAITGARERLVLSLFRCDDYGILDALAAALERGVSVAAILTKRAKGGKKTLKKLWEALGEMGALVHWYADPVVKYHAKYLVADDRLALIATLNPTIKCFTTTLDYVYVTTDPLLVRSVSMLFAIDSAGDRLPPRHRLADNLIVGPDDARRKMRHLIRAARKSIRILDHKLSDPDAIALLRERRAEGIDVSVIGRRVGGMPKPHGKLLILDDTCAVLGSTALSALSLEFRREVSVVIEKPALVRALIDHYDALSANAGDSATALPGDSAA